MIQRIQSLYLLAATAVMAIFFTSSLATFSNTEGLFALKVLGVADIEGATLFQTPYLIIIATLATALPLFTIFMFKKRMLQLRLCVVEMVLALGVVIVEGVYYYLASRALVDNAVGEATSSINIASALPIAAIVFAYLALRGVFRDEMLVKSLDRIR